MATPSICTFPASITMPNPGCFRSYDASSGRYLQSDPMGLNGGIGSYVYVGNNPLRYLDHLGLQAEGEAPEAEFDPYEGWQSAPRLAPEPPAETLIQKEAREEMCYVPGAEPKTPLYRSVLDDELADIINRRSFHNPYGTENKYFSTTPEGAASYAQQANASWGDGPFTTVQTAIGTSAITSDMVPENGVNRGIPTIVVLLVNCRHLIHPSLWVIRPFRDTNNAA